MVGDGLAEMSLNGGAKKPELANLLRENSGADVEWLQSGSVSGSTPWWLFSTPLTAKFLRKKRIQWYNVSDESTSRP